MCRAGGGRRTRWSKHRHDCIKHTADAHLSSCPAYFFHKLLNRTPEEASEAGSALGGAPGWSSRVERQHAHPPAAAASPPGGPGVYKNSPTGAQRKMDGQQIPSVAAVTHVRSGRSYSGRSPRGNLNLRLVLFSIFHFLHLDIDDFRRGQTRAQSLRARVGAN